jgi:hypothetical protein
MVDSQSQALNLQHGDDQALHSLLQEWIAKQAQGRKTKDQTDRKAFPDLDDGTSRTQPSYFSPSGLPSTLQAVLRQSLRLTRTNEPTSKRSAAGHLLGGEHFEPLLAA